MFILLLPAAFGHNFFSPAAYGPTNVQRATSVQPAVAYVAEYNGYQFLQASTAQGSSSWGPVGMVALGAAIGVAGTMFAKAPVAMLQVAGEEAGERASGTVKFFNLEKGYGFIADSEGGDDLFVHMSAVSDGNFPKEGDTVTFESEWDDRKQKWRAANVTGGTGEAMEQRGGYY